MCERKDSFHIRPLETSDLPALCDLMEEAKVSIGSLNSKPAYYAICRDALLNDKVVIVVAEKGKHLAGYVVAIVDCKSYWINFPFRHPISFLSVIFHRLAGKVFTKRDIKKHIEITEDAQPKEISKTPSGRIWRQSSSEIAKIANIHVFNDYRRMGIGRELYKSLFRLLAKRGIKRVDAITALYNNRSVGLHLSTGWKMERTKNNFFATTDITEPNQ